MLDYLAGSDLRKILHDYRNKAKTEFANFSLNYDILLAVGPENMTEDNFLWAYSIVNTRSIWWDGIRHIVPLLDFVNSFEFHHEGSTNTVHKTELDPENKNYAITKATSSFSKGHQLFENYGQPNYIYFMFHGFVLENNSHDCALWEDLRIDVSEYLTEEFNEMKSRLAHNGFTSFSPSFCISNGTSLDRVANFLRIKHGVEGDNLGVQDDISNKIHWYIQQRLHRYRLSQRQFNCSPDLVPPPIKNMMYIIETEKSFFQEASTYLKEKF